MGLQLIIWHMTESRPLFAGLVLHGLDRSGFAPDAPSCVGLNIQMVTPTIPWLGPAYTAGTSCLGFSNIFSTGLLDSSIFPLAGTKLFFSKP